MGGRALLQVGIETKRIDRDSFDELYSNIYPKLYSMFEKVQLIPFYRNKKDFGDMDVLVSGFKNGTNIKENIQKTFNPKVVVCGGNVWSFDQNDFQIDIIKTKPALWETTLTYYSYNDLGNLMGRIARSVGFRYGHYGLKYKYKSQYGFNDRDIIVSQSLPNIFRFLGFDYFTFLEGFDDLEDIFDYVANSTFFNPDVFAYENLDHTNRVRNKKRDSYQKFIEYISEKKLDSSVSIGEYDSWQRAIDLFGVKLNNIIYDFRKQDEKLNSVRQKFNGNIVMGLTRLQGKQLGEFINLFRDYTIDKFKNFIIDFNDYVLKTPEDEIKNDILIFLKTVYIFNKKST